MKNIKNILKKSCLIGIVIFMVNTFAMRMSEAGKKSLQSYIQKQKKQQSQKPMSKEQQEKMEQERKQELEEAFESDEQHIQRQLQRERESHYQPDKYFIYEQDTANGILVDAAMAKLNSTTIKDMVGDLGEEPKEIPLPYTTGDTIKLGFGLLENTVEIHDLLFAQLVDVANLFNFLAVPINKMNVVLMEIKEKIIDKNSGTIVANGMMKQLHPDLQKLLLTENTVDYLKDCIIKKYVKDRGKSLVGHYFRVNTVAFSPDGTKIVSGSEEQIHSIILWDAKAYKEIKDLQSPGWIDAIAFNPDGKSFVAGGSGNADLILWNINDINNITSQRLPGHSAELSSLAFNPNGKSFVAGYSRGPAYHPNLSLYDISDLHNVTFKPLVGHPGSVTSVACSPDGKYIVSSCEGDKNNLILWDIADQENIISYNLAHKFPEYPYDATFVAFLPDGKRFVSCNTKVIILWDISDVNNITFKVLVEDFNNIVTVRIRSLALSYDGTTIVVGHVHGFTLWNINDPSISVSVNKIGIVGSLAFSPDDKQIVTGGYESSAKVGKNLNLWTLITDQEDMLLKQIKNYNADQTRLIYQLCFQYMKDQKITLEKGSEEETIFKTLPQDMQNLLNDLFIPKGWFSGWWRYFF